MTTEDLHRVRNTWDALAAHDPMWAVLTDPAQRGGQWDANSFFTNGDVEIHHLLQEIEATGHVFDFHSDALDFGCGIGRITQALARRFVKAVGVDVAETMIIHARELNVCGDRAEYLVNDAADLAGISSDRFSFAYSRLVLQHMPASLGLGYLREIVRVVRPGGVFVVQVPVAINRPTDDVRLPRSAHRAHVTAEPPPRVCDANTPLTIRATVTNTSPDLWRASVAHPVQLGNHWLSRRGTRVIDDDGRAPIPRSLEPGDTAELTIAVRAPSRPGRYLLELDLVEEGVGWFADSNASPSWRAPVSVRGRRWRRDRGRHASEPAQAVAATLPQMELHVYERSAVEQAIAEAGGRIIYERDDPDAAPGYASRLIVATK